jgi:vacuolar-type H+-ATPase subunit B/Vma2
MRTPGWSREGVSGPFWRPVPSWSDNMNRQRISEIISEGASSIEVMTECLNKFQKLDIEHATETEKQRLKMAVRRFACLIRVQPYPK